MEIESRLVRSFESHDKAIAIVFDPTVRLSRSVPTMTLMTLLANIGGCLCLTLVYSLLQVVLQRMPWPYARIFLTAGSAAENALALR